MKGAGTIPIASGGRGRRRAGGTSWEGVGARRRQLVGGRRGDGVQAAARGRRRRLAGGSGARRGVSARVGRLWRPVVLYSSGRVHMSVRRN